jgi:hypothetical protein
MVVLRKLDQALESPRRTGAVVCDAGGWDQALTGTTTRFGDSMTTIKTC